MDTNKVTHSGLRQTDNVDDENRDHWSPDASWLYAGHKLDHASVSCMCKRHDLCIWEDVRGTELWASTSTISSARTTANPASRCQSMWLPSHDLSVLTEMNQADEWPTNEETKGRPLEDN
jgi:hypothetical protein